MSVFTTGGFVSWASIFIFFGIHLSTVQALGPERRYACWGSFGPPVVSAQCPRNTVIQVVRAGLKVQQHGGVCTYNYNDCGCEYGESGCQMPNVRRLCMGRPACRLDVTQQYISSDKCKGFSDYMYIEFNCVPVGQNNVVSEICSAVTAVSQSGFLRSPSRPRAARGARECDCTLTSEDKSSIQLTVLDIQTHDYNCDHDKLLVAYGGHTDKYCGQEPDNKSIASKSTVVSVKYSTDGQGLGGSFWLKYEAEPKANIKLKCTYRETHTTTKIGPQRVTEASSSQTTSPTTTMKPVREQQLNYNRDTKPKHKPPWWWKFVKSSNATKPIRSIKKGPISPPILVQSSKTIPISKPKISRKWAPPITSPTTNSRYHHYRQQVKRFEANAGKSVMNITRPNAIPSLRSSTDTTGQRWSHLPRSLLKKLQFPLVMIRALEKELVVTPNGKSAKQPYIRFLPKMHPGHFSPKSHQAQSKVWHDTSSSSSDRQKQKSLVYNKYTYAKRDRTTYEHKPSYSEQNNLDYKLPLKNPPTPLPQITKQPHETVHSVIHYTVATKKPDMTDGHLTSGNSTSKSLSTKESNKLQPIMKILQTPTEIPTTAKAITVGTKHSSVIRSSPPKKLKHIMPTKIPDPVKMLETSVNKDVVRKYKVPMSKEGSINTQDAWEEPLDPIPIEEPRMKERPKLRSGSFKSGISRPEPKSKQRYRVKGRPRYNPGLIRKKDRINGKKERLKVKKKKKTQKMKRVWKERADKTWVSVIKPEAKMYLPIRQSERRRMRKIPNRQTDQSYDVLQMSTTVSYPSTSSEIETTTPLITTPLSSTQKLVLKVSVHNNHISANLTEKIKTVSDFYTALDREDWVQWPAFEMIKNAQEQTNRKNNKSSEVVTSTISTTVKTTARPSKSPKPTKVHIKPIKQTKRPPTPKHRKKPKRTISKPSPTFITARPSLFAKSNSLNRSVVKLAKPPTEGSSAFIPTKSESLIRPKNNTITIIAVAACGTILIVVVLAIVIRFAVKRSRETYDNEARSWKGKRYKSQISLDNHHFPGQKIPRPRRI